MKKFSQAVIEKLGYYVYILIDPRNESIFYIGKGKGNRVFSHLNGALSGDKPSDKINLINEINLEGLEIVHYIVRHGLTEKESLEVEGALIDAFGKNKLTNIVAGHNSNDRGIMNIDEVNINYDSKEAEIDDKVILININRLYYFGITPDELYEATRKSWVVSKEQVIKTEYVFSHYRGIIREIYEPKEWKKVENTKSRYEFIGDIASNDIREKYLHKSIKTYFVQGSQNPIKYVNI